MHMVISPLFYGFNSTSCMVYASVNPIGEFSVSKLLVTLQFHRNEPCKLSADPANAPLLTKYFMGILQAVSYPSIVPLQIHEFSTANVPFADFANTLDSSSHDNADAF